VPPLPPATPPARACRRANTATSHGRDVIVGGDNHHQPAADRSRAVDPVFACARTCGVAGTEPCACARISTPPSPEAREMAAVEGVIERYRFAFSTLNSGVSDFWPV
jgi:hypothetical protein